MSLDNIPGVNVDEQAEKAAEVAKEMEEISNGLITKRQAQAYLLMNEAGRSAPDVSSYVGAEVSTIYTLRRNAAQKIEGAKNLTEFLDSEE